MAITPPYAPHQWLLKEGGAREGAAVNLHLCHYNLVRLHKSLRITPAMAAGVSAKLWTARGIGRTDLALRGPPCLGKITELYSERAKP